MSIQAPAGPPAQRGETAEAFDLAELRQVFGTGRTREVAWRLRQLEAIERLCDEREAEIAAALHADLGRPAVEAWLGDIASTKGEAAYARKHLKSWMRPRRQSLPLAQLPGRSWVQHDPLGVVLIIGPWNYPFQLVIAPLVDLSPILPGRRSTSASMNKAWRAARPHPAP